MPSSEELRFRFATFVASDGTMASSTIPAAELLAILTRAGGGQAMTLNDAEDLILELIKAVDVNGVGELDLDEVCATLLARPHPLANSEAPTKKAGSGPPVPELSLAVLSKGVAHRQAGSSPPASNGMSVDELEAAVSHELTSALTAGEAEVRAHAEEWENAALYLKIEDRIKSMFSARESMEAVSPP